jgi:hypothetical protein
MVPVTKGAAALVPENVKAVPLAPRLVIACPGAHNPRRPIDPPKLDSLVGRPFWSHATTGITQRCRTNDELPIIP